jgi:hypothetical protein
LVQAIHGITDLVHDIIGKVVDGIPNRVQCILNPIWHFVLDVEEYVVDEWCFDSQ